MTIKSKKLDSYGIAHHFLLALIIVGVAIFGAYKIVATNAETVNSYYCNGAETKNPNSCSYAATPSCSTGLAPVNALGNTACVGGTLSYSCPDGTAPDQNNNCRAKTVSTTVPDRVAPSQNQPSSKTTANPKVSTPKPSEAKQPETTPASKPAPAKPANVVAGVTVKKNKVYFKGKELGKVGVPIYTKSQFKALTNAQKKSITAGRYTLVDDKYSQAAGGRIYNSSGVFVIKNLPPTRGRALISCTFLDKGKKVTRLHTLRYCTEKHLSQKTNENAEKLITCTYIRNDGTKGSALKTVNWCNAKHKLQATDSKAAPLIDCSIRYSDGSNEILSGRTSSWCAAKQAHTNLNDTKKVISAIGPPLMFCTYKDTIDGGTARNIVMTSSHCKLIGGESTPGRSKLGTSVSCSYFGHGKKVVKYYGAQSQAECQAYKLQNGYGICNIAPKPSERKFIEATKQSCVSKSPKSGVWYSYVQFEKKF